MRCLIVVPTCNEAPVIGELPEAFGTVRTDVPGGRTESWPARLKALSWAANFYIRALLRLRTRDSTSGFRAWRAGALRMAEHAITFTERSAGSSMTGDVAGEASLLAMRWRLRELSGLPRAETSSAVQQEGARQT